MKSTTRFNNIKRGLVCLNCGRPLQGHENFCPECGQVNDDIPLSITQFISEFFAGFFSFDSRFLKTILPLLFKPGKVSKEYIQGRRMKYTNPFKMYLHTSILFFLLTGLMSAISSYKNINSGSLSSAQLKDSIFKVLDDEGIVGKENIEIQYRRKLDSVFRITDYKKQFDSDTVSPESKTVLFNQLKDLGKGISLVDLSKGNIGLDDEFFETHADQAQKYVILGILNTYLKEKEIDYTQNQPIQIGLVDIDFDETTSDFGKFIAFSKDNPEVSPNKALDSLKIEKSRFSIFKYQKARDLNKLRSDKDFRDAYVKNSLSKVSIVLFFFLPLLTLVFSLLYIRHAFTFTEHLVVVFTIQTVFFLSLIIALLLDSIFGIDVFTGVTLVLIFPFYIYKTLRNFYKQSRVKTLLKFFVLSLASFVLTLIGLVLVFFLGFLL